MMDEHVQWYTALMDVGENSGGDLYIMKGSVDFFMDKVPIIANPKNLTNTEL